jgi:hypothetical protein
LGAVLILFYSPEFRSAARTAPPEIKKIMKSTSSNGRSALLALFCFVLCAKASFGTPPAEDFISDAVVTRPAHGSRIDAGAHDSRIKIDPKESVRLDLNLNGSTGDRVRIEAPNGGAINHGRGPIEIDTAKQGRAFGVDFTAGSNPGRYTVEVSQGNSTKIFQFWVGPEPPQGKPGPNLTFTGNR